MLGVTINQNYALKFVIAEGKSLRKQIPPTGNTNTHGLFEPDLKTFLKRWFAEGPTHHFSLGIGHHAAAIQEIAEIMGVESVIISKK
jgi:L-arabinose isomerase